MTKWAKSDEFSRLYILSPSRRCQKDFRGFALKFLYVRPNVPILARKCHLHIPILTRKFPICMPESFLYVCQI